MRFYDHQNYYNITTDLLGSDILKILHLLKTNRFSGAENVVCQIISMFRDDAEYDMVYCSPDGPISLSLEARGVPFLPLDTFTLSEVKRAVCEFKPDVIHAHDVHAGLYAALAGGGYRIIDHIHGNDIGMRKVNKKSLSFRYAASKADKIIWVFESALDDYVFSHNKQIRAKSLILKNVLDGDALLKKAETASETLHPTIVFLGRINDIKDPIRAIRIMAEVIGRIPEATAILIGSGELFDDCSSLIESLGLSERIILAGFMENPYGILRNGKVFLMTSKFEGIPMAAMEAMAFGLPVVTTPADGMKFLVTDGQNGFVSDDDTVLSNDIVKLCQDNTMYDTVSKAALERFRELNDQESCRRILKDIYDGIE